MEKQRMTRQEALKELENLTIDYSMRTAEEIERLDEAVDMAIAALREDAVDRPTCDDAVSRAAAINAVKKNTFRLTFAEEQGCEGHVVWSAEAVYSDVIEGALLELPSAEPERKTGKWNFIGDNMFECTSCGVVYTTSQLNGLRNYDTDPYAPKFCPNCGADMRGEQND